MNDSPKRFRIQLPRGLIMSNDPTLQMDGFTGTLHVMPDLDFERNTVTLTGEHDRTDANSQAAVARLIDAVRRGEGR